MNRLLVPATLLLLLPTVSRGTPGPAEGSGVPIPRLSKRPEMRDAFYRRAVVYLERFRRDDLGQAVRLFNETIKAGPEFAPAYGGLAEARALRYLWNWDASPASLQQALAKGKQGVEIDPGVVETHLGLGLAQVAADRYTLGLAELDRAVSLAPDSFRAHLYRGMILRGLRRLEEAGAEAARALELNPSSPLAYSLLGDYYQDKREYLIARDSYLLATQLDQALLWPRLGLAAAYQKNLNFAAAGKTYDLTERAFPEDSPRCRILAASLLVATQDYDSALKLYENIPEKESLSPPLLRRLMQAGRAYSLERIGKSEQAEFYWSELVREFPKEFDGAIRDRELASQAFESLVRHREEKGESRQVSELLIEACSHEGMSFTLYARLAERQRAAGHPDQAMATLRRGLQGAPQELDLVAVTQAALPVLRSIGAGKRSAPVRREGTALLEDLAARLTKSPTPSYVPYLNLARAEALLQQPSRALEHLRQAVDKGFTGIRRAAEDPDLKELSDSPGFRELTGNS